MVFLLRQHELFKTLGVHNFLNYVDLKVARITLHL